MGYTVLDMGYSRKTNVCGFEEGYRKKTNLSILEKRYRGKNSVCLFVCECVRACLCVMEEKK